jgi:lysophospholipase L1-like esterase
MKISRLHELRNMQIVEASKVKINHLLVGWLQLAVNKTIVQSRLVRQCSVVTTLSALVLAALLPANAQQFALKNGDTVVFYGDSITAQRLYTKFAEEFVLTRYPTLHVRFVNAGVPGDTVYGGYAGAMPQRVQRDVAPFYPTMITVMLGMNDGGYVAESPRIDAIFQKGYRRLVDALRKAAPAATITLICPTPYDEITHGTEFPGYSRVLDQEANDVSQIAAQLEASGDKHIRLVDFYRPMTEALDRAEKQFPQLAPLLIPGRIHPGKAASWIMAATLLSAWHVDPIVDHLTLNAQSAAMVRSQRTTLTNLHRSTSGLQWTQLDQALPLPLDFNNAMSPVLLGVSDISLLDQQILQVEALDPGSYRLLIDGKSIATFSNEELQRGVNLALYKTPMLDQARGIDWNEERRATLDRARFILSAEVKETATTAVAEEKLQEGQDQLAAQIRTNLPPHPHSFELQRQ